MKLRILTLIGTLLASVLFSTVALADDDYPLRFAGKEGGPGAGKKVVLIAGDEEYRSEEALPMLGKILSQHHGFDCTVLFSLNEEKGYIDPNASSGIKGWNELIDADLVIIATRFRKPSVEDAQYMTDYLNGGGPIIGLRTATHAFNGPGEFGSSIPYGQWGLRILGERWVNHHGKHKQEGARGVIEEAYADHPVLNGVEDVFAPSDVYGVVNLTDDATILMRGAVTETLDPSSPILEGEKNDPMMPLAWLREYTSPSGKARSQAFCCTAGASVDLVSEDLRRLVVNAALHLSGLEVPEQANVAYVDPFEPSFYGFIKDAAYWEARNLQPSDFALGVPTMANDPKGSPEWPFRD